jgi:hypothetical protein
MNKQVFHIIVNLIIFLFTGTGSDAQDEPYYHDAFIRNDNATYRKNIQTVILHKAGFELSPPIIQLNTDEKLILTFDDLESGYKQYRYTIVHCDAFWNASNLLPMEYIEGFMDDFIEDYKYSFNTTVPYINYMLVFPSDDLRLKKSGNYIIRIFLDSDNEENAVFTRRFMVYEPMVTVQGRVANSVDLDLRYTHHQINFKILTGNYRFTDSYKNLHVIVMQNGRWDNIIKNVQPRMIIGGEYDYSLVNELVFPAGNEYRYLDMKTLKYNTDRMQSLQYTEDGYQVYIMTDMPRNKGNYFTEEDINGRRLIAANDTRDPYTEGDYAGVHFLLPYNYPLIEGNLYVFGALSDWQFNPANLMHYNYELKAYEARLFLKQGYYNYEYAFLANRSNIGDVTLIEGSYWETRNEYTIFVYHQQQGEYYDRLVGIGFVESVGQ